MKKALLSEQRAIELLPMALCQQPGVTPFPWQERLLRRLLKDTLPSAVDLPTGLGKTSVIAIWLLARAAGATVPLRLVYVVDRRAVVDQASAVADHLADLVKRTPDLAAALSVDTDRGLAVSTLRGQHIDNRRWIDDPSVPAIIVGTVDMIGSRLLFEGYGVSRKTRSLHAAHLGIDSLLVLDEAHLSPAFEDLVRVIADKHFDGSRTDIVPPRVKLLPLSATQRSSTNAVFSLDGADKNHVEVTQRLSAQKWMKLHHPVEEGDSYAAAVADLALVRIKDGARRVVVYQDSREQVQKAREAFAKLAKAETLDVDTELLVGARRVFERGQVADWLVAHGFQGNGDDPRRGVLFATSAGEVGVDLDTDHLVCDLVAFERMVQRLGRVNRRGKTVSLVDIVPLKAKKKKAKTENDEEDSVSLKDADINLVAKLLASLCARDEDGRRNLSPQALRELQTSHQVEVAAASTPTPLHPALTRPLVESWAMTSLWQHTARPKVDPWLRGWVDIEPQTTVVWRKHLPVNDDHKTLPHALVRAYFDAAPTELIETLETETFNVTKWIADLRKKIEAVPEKLSKMKSEVMTAKTDAARATKEEERSALEALPKAEDIVGFLVDSDGDVVIEDGIAGYTLEMLAALEVSDLVGKTLFVDVRLGGLDHGLFDAKGDAGEVDVGEGRTTRITLQTTTATDRSKDWRRLFTAPVDISEDGDIEQYLVIDQLIESARPNEEGLSVSKEQTLTEHQQWAQEEAQRIGASLGLPPDDIKLLATAAVHHDDGKASVRWQSAFHAPAGEPLAKVGKWIDQSILGGYRHEAGSLLGLMGKWDVFPAVNASMALSSLSAERQELAKHLVSSHHGWSRPTLPVGGIEAIPPSKLVDLQHEVAERFAALQETWGPWGLAWWEALLRAADGIASRKNEKKGGVL